MKLLLMLMLAASRVPPLIVTPPGSAPEAVARSVPPLRVTAPIPGLAEPSKVPPLLGIADALLHLSHREGLPRALPQALAVGKPVIAYACDGAPEVCLEGETGFLTQPGDLQTLCRAGVHFLQ